MSGISQTRAPCGLRCRQSTVTEKTVVSRVTGESEFAVGGVGSMGRRLPFGAAVSCNRNGGDIPGSGGVAV